MTQMHRRAELVAGRAAAMTLYARQWLPDAAAAEDVVQDALMALLMQTAAIDDPVAWMFRAVRNAAIDQARIDSRRRRREEIAAAQRDTWFEPAHDAMLDADVAERALRALPPESREVVVLRVWGEVGFAQIAETLGVSVSTAHRRYVAAIEQLRQAMEEPCSAGPTTTTSPTRH